MDSDRWKQIEALYHSALTVDASAREDFLASACAGDEGLRREVLSLLSSAERLDSFLEEPALNLGLRLLGARRESLAGKTVGRYKLLELLGQGGMGEVYLAHDPRLNRRVALKLLTAEIGDDPERVRRFEQEARAASAISHPNVAHIYENGEEWGRHYITMEYVRGRTLRDALKRGPLQAREALGVAAQIAAALAAAHEVGVVHRDVKPENVILRDDGYIKVLDFGLAKLVACGASAPGEEEEESRPLPSLHTAPEILMGTADYMSPEQVRRRPADERTDLWSLGVVLYEMLAGRRPFRGCEPSEVIVAVLEQEPEPLADLRPGLPQAVYGLVGKALSKRASDRYKDARGFEAELRRALRLLVEPDAPVQVGSGDEPEAQPNGPSPTAAGELPGVASSSSARPFGVLGRMSDFRPGELFTARVYGLARRWRPAHLVVLLSLVVAVAGLGIMRGLRQSLQTRALNLRFERLNLSGDVGDLVISPDGKYVASAVAEAGKQAIRVTELATAGDLRITAPSDAGYTGLSFSPDGTYIYYLETHAETSTLYRVSKLGGGQRRILDNVNTAVTFSPDGSRMAFVRSNKSSEPADLVVAQADGTAARVLARRSLADGHFFLSDAKGPGPVWSPDGRTMACPTWHDSGGQIEFNLEALDTETGAAVRVNSAPWNDISRVAWLADGSGLLVAAKAAAGAPWQLQMLAYPGGEVRQVTNDPNNYTLVSGTRDSGLFLTRNVEESTSVWHVAADDGVEPSVLGVSQKKGVAEVDWGAGGRLLYTVNDGNHANLWVEEPGAGGARQLTFEADNFKPALSPDGRHVIFVSTRAGVMNLWRVGVDGTQPLRLTSGGYEDLPSLMPDGRWVIYRTGTGLWKVSIDGGAPVRLFDKSALSHAISPDGRLLAFFTNDRPDSQTWHIEVYNLSTLALVKRFELPEATSPFNSMTLTPDNRLRWTPDGHGLSYVSNADGASNVWVQPLGGGAARRLTHFRDAEILSFAWSADGRQLACVRNMKAYVSVLVRLF
jgi:serine/threonine protein kinase/Tol biopolymer transport system component